MKASDLSPRPSLFSLLKESCRRGSDNDKTGLMSLSMRKYICATSGPLLFLPFFFNSLLCSRTSNLFASGATLARLPSLTKDLVFSFFLLFRSFFAIPEGKVGLNISFFFHKCLTLLLYLISLPLSHTCLPLRLSHFEGVGARRPGGWKESGRV